MIDKFVVRAEKYGAYPIPPISSISEEELYSGEYLWYCRQPLVGMYPNVDGIRRRSDFRSGFPCGGHGLQLGVNQICQDGKGTRDSRGWRFVNAILPGARSYEIWTQRQFSEAGWKPCMKNF